MRFELIKLYKKRKGFLLIIVFCILKLTTVFLRGYDSHYVINQNRAGYESYIKQLSGKITNAKKETILNEYDSLKRTDVEIVELFEQLSEGKITEEDYMTQCKYHLENEKNRYIFQVIYSKYVYAIKDVENHYIMDSRGWETLLTHDNFDYLLIFCILVLITQIFNYEYESKMDIILKTCKKGNVNVAMCKLSLAIITSVGLTCLSQLITFVYLKCTVGLPNGNYPIQSIPFFEGCEYAMTLQEVFYSSLLLKSLGSILFALMISLIALFSKKHITTLILGALVVFLPALVFQNDSTQYYLPFPTGLIKANGYFWPSQFEIRYNDKGEAYKYYLFHHVKKKYMIALIMGYVLENIILFLICIRNFSIKHVSIKSKRYQVKKGLCILLLTSLVFSGCNKSTQIESYIFSEEQNRLYGNYQEKEIYLESESELIMTDGKETENLLRDVFSSDLQIVSIFVRGHFCYYLCKEMQDTTVRIYQIDLRNRECKLLYNTITENREDYFGLVKERQEENDIFEEMEPINSFFVTEDYIYIRKPTKMEQIHQKSKKKKIILSDMSTEMYCYANDRIYYVTTAHRLAAYDIKEGAVGYVDDIFTDYIKIEGNTLFYTDLLDAKKIKHLQVITT